MKIKYRIVVDVESDTELEDTPDKWDMDAVMDAHAELVSYEVLEEKPKEKKS